MGGPAYHHVRKAQHLHQRPWEAQPSTMVESIPALTSMTMGGPACHHVEKAYVYLRLPDSSLPLGRNLDLKYTKLLFEVFKLHSSHF